jgi:hypothetical protein
MSSIDPSWDGQARVDATRLWAGGVATALVAAGVAVVGVLALRALLHVSVLAPGQWDVLVGDTTTVLPIVAALAALIATGLLHLLMATTPRAPQFFAWLVSLVVAVILLQVFVTGTTLVQEAVTSALYLLIAVATSSLLYGVGRTALRYERRPNFPDETYRRDRAPQEYRRYWN